MNANTAERWEKWLEGENVAPEGEHFKTGDTVALKSGGPSMTVRVHRTGNQAWVHGWREFVLCDWLDVDGRSHEQKFHPDQLVKA